MSRRQRKLLIVSPGFHGYHAAIARAFGSLGYDVESYCYDAVDSSLEKAWNKVRHELPAKLGGVTGHQSAATVSRRAAARVREVRPDVVLAVRADTLTEDFWAVAAENARPVAVWMYDEMRRTAFDAELVARYARLATYSAHDALALTAAGHDAVHVPLGYDDSREPASSTSGDGLVSFVGARSSARESALRVVQDAGVPVCAWGRDWSEHPLDRARTWRVRATGLPNGRDVPGDEALAIMRNSLATLNVHGDQDGFTMRTFEAAGVGAVQLVDRADVERYYEPGREVLVYTGHDELVEHVQEVAANPGDFASLRRAARARTCAEHTLRHRAKMLEGLW